MQTFKDNLDQQWNLSLTLGKVRKLREKLGLDLLNPAHYMQVLDSLTDRIAFVFLLCEEQSREYEIDVDAFEERLMGEGFIDDASNAFLKETKDFFQRLGQVGLAKLSEKAIQSMASGQARVADLVSTGQFDLLMDDAQSAMETLLPESDGAGSTS